MEILGIDIGGSGIKGAPVNSRSGKMTAERKRIPTPNPATPEEITDTFAKIVKYFNWSGSIGCGFPAVVRNGIVGTASNIDKRWIGQNVCQLFTEAAGAETVVVNDADAAGVAEMALGAGRGNKGVVVIITVGTGLGTAVFSNGHLFPNTELGHILIDGIIAENFTSDAVRKKEDLSWKKWTKRFNVYLAEIERLLWPDLIIIGGGVSKKQEKFFKYLEKKTKVVPAKLLNEAGIIGAAMARKFF